MIDVEKLIYISSEEYFKIPAISRTDLVNYNKGIEYYHYYKQFNVSDKPHNKLGTAFHCLILESETFKDKYLVIDCIIPDGIFGKFLEIYSKTNDFDYAYTNSGYKLDKEVVKGYLQNPETKQFNIATRYLNETKTITENSDKVILSNLDMTILNNMYESVRMNKGYYDVQSMYSYVQNEITIVFNKSNLELPYKARIDQIICNKESNTITIIELKHTGKPIFKFKDAILEYDYSFQLSFYASAIRSILLPEYSNCKIELAILVCESIQPYCSRLITEIPETPNLISKSCKNLEESLNKQEYRNYGKTSFFELISNI